MKNKVFIFLAILFIAHFLFRIYEYRAAYLTPYDADYWKQKYENSQWSTKPACENLDPHVNPYTCTWDDEWYAQNKNNPHASDLKKNAIGDDGVYTYAGWAYVHGHDPTTLNAEIPPFGKYLIGASEIIFKNQNIFSLFAGLFALGSFYLLNTLAIRNKQIAFIPVALLSFEPLFYTQLRAPYLDLLYLGLLCLVMYFFLKKKYITSAIFIGLMAATKSAASTFPLVIGIFVGYLLLTKHYKELKQYIFSLPVAGFLFLATYIRYFLNGHSFQEFLGVQKWIVNFYSSGAKGSFSAPWEMLFAGSWHNWWGQVSYVSEWHFGWPLLVLGSIFSSIILIQNNRLYPVLLILIWTIVYLIFLSFVPVWPRYLLLVIPFMYTLIIFTVVEHKNRK